MVIEEQGILEPLLNQLASESQGTVTKFIMQMTSFSSTIFANEDDHPTGLVSFYSKLLLTLTKHVQVGSDAAKKISEQAAALLQLKETTIYSKLKQSLADI